MVRFLLALCIGCFALRATADETARGGQSSAATIESQAELTPQQQVRDALKASVDVKTWYHDCSTYIEKDGSLGHEGKIADESISKIKDLQWLTSKQAGKALENVCPGFNSENVTGAQKRQFWVWVLSGIIHFESGCDRKNVEKDNESAPIPVYGALRLPGQAYAKRAHLPEECAAQNYDGDTQAQCALGLLRRQLTRGENAQLLPSSSRDSWWVSLGGAHNKAMRKFIEANPICQK